MFLLTHNFYFFRKVRKNIKGTECYELDASGKCIVDAKGNKQRKFCKHWQKNNLEDKQIYQIVKKGSNSNIVPPSLYLLKYNSEYLTLIENFINYKKDLNSGNYSYEIAVSMLNTMRRILETFLENKYPTTKGSGFNGKFKSSLKDKARDDLEYMADILNIGSHWENPFPALDYSSFESFEKLTDDYLEYIKLMDKDFYDNVFKALISSSVGTT